MTPEQVADHEAALAAHYGEPVRPVSVYCAAFAAWAEALRVRASREDSPHDENLEHVAQLVNDSGLQLAIAKSSMLGRLIYGGEELRTQPCPEHEGAWSGVGMCSHGCDLTGWLPAEDA